MANKINYSNQQREGEICTIVELITNGVEIRPGDEFIWNIRFGDESNGWWSRGRSTATVEMISEVESKLAELYPRFA